MTEVRTVAVIDYGAGNLGNARRALDELALPHKLVRSSSELPPAGPILLPGVGNYGTAMDSLTDSGLAAAIRTAGQSGRRVVGICLGLQLMFSESEEAPGVPGLGMIAGRVRRLRGEGVPIPHLGWAPVGRAGIPVYFAHSFVVEPSDPSTVLSTASWGEPFAAVVRQGDVMGFQFHPERSGDAGLELLDRSLMGEGVEP